MRGKTQLKYYTIAYFCTNIARANIAQKNFVDKRRLECHAIHRGSMYSRRNFAHTVCYIRKNI